MALKISVKETAFAILHMQNDIIDPKGSFGEAGAWKQVQKYSLIEKVAKAASASRDAGMMVIYGNCVSKPYYPSKKSKLFQMPIMLRFWKTKGAVKGTWGYENPKELKPKPKDIIVDNFAADCFMHTDLDLILRGNGISSLVVTGYATTWVVSSTTRHGAELGYNIIAIKDCMQSFTDEMHNFGINIELPGFAQVVTLDEYLAVLP